MTWKVTWKLTQSCHSPDVACDPPLQVRYCVHVMARRYDLSNYDDYMCLKPPALLWVAVLYLSRAIVLPVVLGFSSMGGGTADVKAFAGAFFSVNTMAPSVIAFLVLCPLMRRSPSGLPVFRWIWAHGRSFLAAAALLDFALTARECWHTGMAEISGLSLLAAALDLYFLTYILFAQRVRDVFADFPTASLR